MAISIRELKRSLDKEFESLVRKWFPLGCMNGSSEYLVLNHSRKDNKCGSFSINFSKRIGFDFATGEFFDIINLFALCEGIANGEAIKRLMIQHSAGSHLSDEKRSHSDAPMSTHVYMPNIAPQRFEFARMHHMRHGTPVAVYEYRNKFNQLIGYVARFEGSAEAQYRSKKLLPMSWSMQDEKMGWHWNEKGWNGVKPIYGIEKLASNPLGVVLITEGEKTCDAAQRLFPHAVCLSWRGGAGTADKVQWHTLRDRIVVVWPDNDRPGIHAAGRIIQSIPNAKMVNPPAWKESAWDLADAENEAIEPKKLMKHIFASTGVALDVT